MTRQCETRDKTEGMWYRGLAKNQFKLSSFLRSPWFLVSLRSENRQESCQPKASFWYFPKAVQSYNKKPEWERGFFSVCLFVFVLNTMPVHVLVFHEKGFSQKCVPVFHLFFFSSILIPLFYAQ